ncbi:MAG: hypothetical protein MJA82_04260 [Clostridia bacterium]|nr:hypothetical protein [Clostridia bacterium]
MYCGVTFTKPISIKLNMNQNKYLLSWARAAILPLLTVTVDCPIRDTTSRAVTVTK